jgi:hypothetical protein
MALRCSIIRLKKVLLPTLGLPTMATVYPGMVLFYSGASSLKMGRAQNAIEG